MDIRKKHTQKTYSAIHHLYTEDFEKDYENFYFIDDLLKLVKLHRLQKHPLVDLGTGPGNVIDYILKKENKFASIIGVDFEKNFTDRLRVKYQKLDKIKVVHEDMLEFTARQKHNSIGTYIASYSLIHIPDFEIDELFLFIQRSLVKRGLFLFSCYRGNRKMLEQEPYQLYRDTRLRHEEILLLYMNYFTEQELKERLLRVGLDIIKLEILSPPSGKSAFPHKQIWVIAEKV
ncbi:hypothetical protein A3C98_01845 [Candidatus Roizmanbacteria bacterium RIFCSPHIGHO2_02_FULL_37_15]|nr:MAG: hypothetical protein A3C98_01845 [Candidatus Roizmanbacteria bacterium RIFCSPHIGHO2_02_FULL_37_15]OGK34107.1 MAG: hypothetical protein A3F57_06710 [Candidatus Roizmanbacteria bacterium RIFCSPHIGHO2_12_FULL_36_11]